MYVYINAISPHLASIISGQPCVVSGGCKCVRNVSGRDEESARNIITALIDSQVRGQHKVSLNYLFSG